MTRKMKWPFFTLLFALISFQNIFSQDQTSLMGFEDEDDVPWTAVSWSDDPFTKLELSDAWASEGEMSLKTEFSEGEYKWGGELSGFGSEEFLERIQDGGTLLLDMHIPEESFGITHIGFALQQPGAEQNDWQQNWFEVNERTGVFTIELPFSRENDQPINLYLGKTTNGGGSYTVYFDNFRFESLEGGGNTNDPILLSSFENQQEIDAWMNTEWSDDPYNLIERSESNATEGSYAFRATFGQGEWKWGANLPNISDVETLASIEYGGTLLLDLFIPETSTGISNIGFSIQQPEAEQPLDWQQVWFNLEGATGYFVIELPFDRVSDGPITLHLGKNAPEPPLNEVFEVFFDNLQIIPNDPPSGPSPVIVETTIFGFEDGTTFGFGPTGFSDSPFKSFLVVEENPAEGSKSLEVKFDGAEWKWGASINGLTDLDAMRAINAGKALLIDVHIPEDMTGIQNIGLTLQEQDVTDSWQQAWFNIGGETGTFTIKLPYERLGSAPVNIHLGQNSDEGNAYTIFFDNLRVESEQRGASSGPVNITSISRSDSQLTLTWQDVDNASYELLFSTDITGIYESIRQNISNSPVTLDLPASENGFFILQSQISTQPEIDYIFFDDLEGDLGGWEAMNDGTDWESGTPSGTPEKAFSGNKVFGTSIDSAFAPNTFSSLRSPLIDLTEVNQSKNLFITFRYFLDIDTENAGAFVNLVDESGAVIAADLSILVGKTQNWKGILVAVPDSVKGSSFRIEWLFFSDETESQGSGVFIDDIGVEISP